MNSLYTRDGLTNNSPRYSGFLSPPYQRYLKDDTGKAIDLTGVPSGNLSITFVNQSNPLLVKTGGGIWSIPTTTAPQGLVSYQYSEEDLAYAGNWYLFVTLKIPGEVGQRAFDPELLTILIIPGEPLLVTIQQVDLEELNGQPIGVGNPVPISGPVSIADGANVAQGSTTDSSSAPTTIGLLKAIKAYLAGTLTATEPNSAAILADLNSISSAAGSPSDAAWSGTGAGSEIAILKKLVAELAATLNVSLASPIPAGTNVIGHVVVDSGSVSLTSGGVKLIDAGGTNQLAIDSSGKLGVNSLPALPAGTNVIGHVVVDSAGSVSITSLPSLPAGTNVIGHIIVDSGSVSLSAGSATIGGVKLVDTAGTNQLAIDSAGKIGINALPALPAGTNVIGHVVVDSAGSVAVTSLPSLPAGTNVIGHIIVDSGSVSVSNFPSEQSVNLNQVNGSNLSNTNPVPTQEIEQAGYVAASSPPSTTSAGSDTTYTFSQQVNRVIIQNNTSGNVYYAFDQTASAGSFLLVPGATVIYSKKVTAVHLFTAAAQNINGTTAGNIVLLGAL